MLVASLDSENKLKFALGIKEGDIRETSKQFLKTLDGKGGGAAALVQGSINATSEEAEKLFYQMFL